MTGISRAAMFAVIVVSAIALLPTTALAQLEIKPTIQPAAATVDWKTATELNKVDFTGLTAPQKELALKLLRSENCVCGCGMKLAECRVRDQACPMSPGLAEKVVKGVKDGKSEADIVALLKTADAAKPGTLAAKVEIPVAGAPSKGPKDAKVTIVEFSDFECPFCSKAIAWVDSVLAAYPKDVQLVFKQFPLPMHKNAKLAALASLAADKQGKFWPMHDKLFANYRTLTRENIETWAKEFSLDMPKFIAALDSEELSKRVDQDVLEGQKAGVSGTPSFFINGQMYSGPRQSVDSIKPLIDEALKGAPAQTKAAAK